MKYMDYLQKYQDLGQRDWKDNEELMDLKKGLELAMRDGTVGI